MNIPRIFVSATSSDLRSARQIVKEALLTINCHPIEQTNFPPDYRAVEQMLREKIKGCQALVHLAGMRYGGEPDPQTLAKGADRRSFTQMEYDIARELNLRVYTFLLPENYPYDTPRDSEGQMLAPELEEKKQLQKQHRLMLKEGLGKDGKIKTAPLVYECPVDQIELRSKILALQEVVISLTEEKKKTGSGIEKVGWMSAIIIALVLALMGGGYYHYLEQKKILAAMNEFAHVVFNRQAGGNYSTDPLPQVVGAASPSNADAEAAAISQQRADIEKEYGLAKGSLATFFPAFLQAKLNEAKTPTLVRAHILFFQKHYAKAETMALQARKEELATTGDLTRVKESLRLAGRSARELAVRSEGAERTKAFDNARKHFQLALDIASPDADFYQWALVKVGLSMTAALEGHFDEMLQQVTDVQALAQDSSAYSAFMEVSDRLESIGQPVWAGKVTDVVLKMAPQPPPGSLDLLNQQYLRGKSRYLQLDYKGSESYFNQVMEGTGSLSDAAAATLAARTAYMLASAINAQADFPRAVLAARRAVALSEKSLGAEDWMTLWSRVILARALAGDNQTEKAKAENQELLKLFTLYFQRSKAKAGMDNPYTMGALSTMASLDQVLGNYSEAAATYRQIYEASLKSFGEDNWDTGTAKIGIAYNLYMQQKYAEAEPLFRDVWQRRKHLRTEADAETLWAELQLARTLDKLTRTEESEQLYLEVVKSRINDLKLEDLDTVTILGELGGVQVKLQKHAAAEDSVRQAQEILGRLKGPGEQETLRIKEAAAMVLFNQKKYAEAEPIFREVLKRRQQLSTEIDTATLGTQRTVADCLFHQKKYAECEPIYLEVIEARVKVLKLEDIGTAMLLRGVSNAQVPQKKFAASEISLRHALDIYRKTQGPADKTTIIVTNELVYSMEQQKKYAEARTLYEGVRKELEEKWGHDAEPTVAAIGKLGSLNDANGDFAAAESCYREYYLFSLKKSGADDSATLWAQSAMANMLLAQQKYAAAEAPFRDVLERRQRLLPADHADTLWTQLALARTLGNLDKNEESAQLFLAVIKARLNVLKLEDMETAGLLREVSNAQRKQQKYSDAAHSLQQALAMARKIKGPEDPATLDITFDLGYTLELEKKYPEAKALYEAAWEGRKKTLGADAEPTLEALGRLGMVNDAAGDFTTAVGCYRDYYALYLKKSGADHPATSWGRGALANSLFCDRQYTEAETLAREAWEQSKRLNGADAAGTLWAQNLLALSLQQLGNTTEARELFQDILEKRRSTLQPGDPLLKQSEDALKNF